METQTFTFASSHYAPIAIGFFGLATGYFIWAARLCLVFPRQARKSIDPWACGAFGCPDSCSSLRASTCWLD